MPFIMTWDGWDELNVRERRWLQKRVDGLILLKLISENGHGIDREVSLDADAVIESDIWYGMIECNRYYRG